MKKSTSSLQSRGWKQVGAAERVVVVGLCAHLEDFSPNEAIMFGAFSTSVRVEMTTKI